MLHTFLKALPNGVVQRIVATYFTISIGFRSFGIKSAHSDPLNVNMPGLKVKILPALSDNYMYLVIDDATRSAAIVDPVDPTSVIKAVEQEKVSLEKVLTTHHHWDHAGGNTEMAKMFPGIEVYGGDKRIDALTKVVENGTKFNLGNLTVECFATPCHTTGHICYFIHNPSEPSASPAVFTGDTLFIAGCGRFFEGTPDQMYNALVKKLGKLPDDTNVFCGHEYTVSNLKFASTIEPENEDIKKKMEWAIGRRNDNLPTVPSTIGEEKLYNPFMRVEDLEIQSKYKTNGPIATMKEIRNLKDVFKA